MGELILIWIKNRTWGYGTSCGLVNGIMNVWGKISNFVTVRYALKKDSAVHKTQGNVMLTKVTKHPNGCLQP